LDLFLDFSISFENIIGQEVFKKEFDANKNNFSYKFNISQFSEGMYYVKIITENGRVVKLISKN